MAGKNQHFIPQFMQRGFVSTKPENVGFGHRLKSTQKKKSKVWVFDGGKKAYLTSVRNKGAERYFYGAEGSEADTRITSAESEYAELVNELRMRTVSDCLSSDRLRIAELVAHLFIRTKHVRSSLKEAGDLALELTESLLRDRASFEIFVRKALKKNAGEIEKRFYGSLTPAQQKIIRENPRILSAGLEQVTTEMVSSNPFSESFFQQFKDEIPKMARNSHIKQFSESVAPVDRVEQLGAFHWFLYVESYGSFVLGDTISLCQAPDGRYKSCLSESRDCERIFLPISSQHILVGSPEPRIHSLNVEAINQASAAISRDFFIASQNTDRERSYAQLLNTASAVIEADELEKVKEQVQQEYLS